MGFVSRHSKRDEQLPKERDALLEEALVDLIADDDVLAIYLGGSLAKGDFDNYSDIDLHIVVRPEKKSDFIQNKRKRSGKWGKALFYEDASPASPVVVTHYTNFVKIDSWYHTPEEVEPSIWLKGLEVLHDPDQLIQPVFDESAAKHYTPSPEEVNVWRSKVLAFVHETYRGVMRKELYAAVANLDKIRWLITAGWYMEMGERIDGTYGHWSKLEGDRSRLTEWQLSLLESWDCTREETSIMKTMTSVFPEFLRLNTSLSEKLEIAEDKQQIEQVLSMVV